MYHFFSGSNGFPLILFKGLLCNFVDDEYFFLISENLRMPNFIIFLWCSHIFVHADVCLVGILLSY